MNKYYYLKNDSQHGPVSIDELKTKITRETLVWCEGMPGWVAAKDVAEIAAVLPPPAPKYATPPPPLQRQHEPTINKPNSSRRIILTLSILSVLILGGYKFVQYMQYIESEAKLGASPVAITGWEDQVKLSATYSAIRIGGIRDVVVTVNNQWCCKIEELIVSVHYIKENGEEFDVERITLRHIEQGETKIQTAKGARRGSNINLSIYEIHSKEGHVDYRTFE